MGERREMAMTDSRVTREAGEGRKRKWHSCEEVLTRTYSSHTQAEDGERWTCTCGLAYEHICDEAKGCSWTLLLGGKRRKP